MSVVRRQFFFLFVVACAVSLAAEGRLAPWLVLDAGVSAAFMPAIQLLAFFVIWRVRIQGRSVTSNDALAFLDGNTPWLWWWCAFAAMVAFVPPRSLGPWMTLVWVSLPIPFAWGAVRNFRWLRFGYGRTSREAAIDVCVLRLVTWGAGLVYFFGIAVWYGEVPKVLAWWHA